jgi:biotin carboxylase
MSEPNTILCLASFEKGHAFLREAKRQGWRVFLLTSKSLEGAPWPRESIDEIFFVPDEDKIWKRDDVILGASHLARRQRIHRIVALDDYDVETAAALREHLRVPGMGETTARYFRDKLAMRVKARDERHPGAGVRAGDQLRRPARFHARCAGPVVAQAAVRGFRARHQEDRARRGVMAALDELGDRQSFHLLERFVPGEVFHVDSVVSEREVVFAIACRYGAPPMQVVHGGGIFSSRTLEYGSADEQQLLAANATVLSAMGYLRGVSHTEFIKAHDGTFHFLETSARAGGANLMEMIEAATGLNLWAEWARWSCRNRPIESARSAASMPPCLSPSPARNGRTSMCSTIRKWCSEFRSAITSCSSGGRNRWRASKNYRAGIWSACSTTSTPARRCLTARLSEHNGTRSSVRRRCWLCSGACASSVRVMPGV